MKWDLTERLRGKYRVGPDNPYGAPEYGWRQMPVGVAIQLEAAEAIENLQAVLRALACDLIPVAGPRCSICYCLTDVDNHKGHAEGCLLFVPPVELTEEQRRKDDDATSPAEAAE